MAAAPLRIFLSSSVFGLQPFRAIVADTLLSWEQLPIGMEQFSARPGGAIEVSTESLDSCDIYVGIIAWRYGTIEPGESKSITHLEYDDAVARNIPRYIFLATESTRQNFDLFPADARDPEHETELLALRTYLEQNEAVGYFDSVAELGRKVSISVGRELQKRLLATSKAMVAFVPPLVLPPQTPDFVGRERELEVLCTRLLAGQSMSLSAVVVGMGGVGKSTLAAEAVRRLAENPATFPAGIAFVRCDQKSGMAGLADVYDQILTLWQRPLSGEEASRASSPEFGVELRETVLRRHLSGSSRGLVLLDNVERDLPLDRLVEVLLGVNLTALVTSRYLPSSKKLGVLRLDVLTPDPARALFRDRYTERGGEWQEERDAVATLEVVQGLGYLPLAIELAAARAALRSLTPADVGQELREPGVLAKLTDADDAAASVRYTLEKSLDTLPQGEQAPFAALSLLRGPDAPRMVAEAVLGSMGAEGTDAGAMLDRLAAFSLVEVFALPLDAGAAYRQRVRLHPLLRELAEEHWQEVPTTMQETSIEALLTALDTLVGGYGEDILSEAREEVLIAEVIRLAARRQMGLRATRDLIWHWNTYLDRGGHWQLYADLLSMRLQLSQQLQDRYGEGATFTSLGLLAHDQGRYDEAALNFAQSLAIFSEMGDRDGESVTLNNLGNLARDQGRYDEAALNYEHSLAIKRELGDRDGDGTTLMNLGNLASDQGRYDEAATYYEQSLAISQELGDRAGEGLTMNNLGNLRRVQGRYDEAATYYEQSLAIIHELGDRGTEGTTLTGMGNLAGAQGKYDEAAEYYEQSLAIAREMGEQLTSAHALYNLGLLARRQERIETAHEYFTQALSIYTALGVPAAADARSELADLAHASPRKRGFWPWQR